MKERSVTVVAFGVILCAVVLVLALMSSPGLRPKAVIAAENQSAQQQASYEARIVALENVVNDLSRRVTALEGGVRTEGPVYYSAPVYSAPAQGSVEPSAPTTVQSTQSNGAGCDPSYPSICIAVYPPDLDCGQIRHRRFQVLPPDPHNLDGDHDGIGCE